MFYSSPIGMIEYEFNDCVLTFLKLHPGQKASGRHNGDAVCNALDAYFAGSCTTFNLNVSQSLTPFQQQVLDYVSAIPYGETCTYGDIAKMFGRPMSSQAVGQALNRNGVCIIVPCHRVVAGCGIGGYAPGIAAKKFLLNLEATTLGKVCELA